MAALTGGSLASSGAAAAALFRRRGMDAAVNQTIVGCALGAAALLGAAAGALAGGGAAWALLGPETANRALQAGVAAALCFCVGAAMTTVLTPVVLASTRAVFVAFALSPRALARTHPAHLARLGAAWGAFHPEALRGAGYGAAALATGGAGAPHAGAGAPHAGAPKDVVVPSPLYAAAGGGV